MASLVRRLQIRIFKQRGVRRVPVLHPTTGNVMAWLWPLTTGQLAYSGDGVPLFPHTRHDTLQPLIDILASNQVKLNAA